MEKFASVSTYRDALLLRVWLGSISKADVWQSGIKPSQWCPCPGWDRSKNVLLSLHEDVLAPSHHKIELPLKNVIDAVWSPSLLGYYLTLPPLTRGVHTKVKHHAVYGNRPSFLGLYRDEARIIPVKARPTTASRLTHRAKASNNRVPLWRRSAKPCLPPQNPYNLLENHPQIGHSIPVFALLSPHPASRHRIEPPPPPPTQPLSLLQLHQRPTCPEIPPLAGALQPWHRGRMRLQPILQPLRKLDVCERREALEGGRTQKGGGAAAPGEA